MHENIYQWNYKFQLETKNDSISGIFSHFNAFVKKTKL